MVSKGKRAPFDQNEYEVILIRPKPSDCTVESPCGIIPQGLSTPPPTSHSSKDPRAADLADSAELAALLEYMEGNGVEDGDELLKRIDEKVALATADKEVRAQMRLEDKHALDLRDTKKKSRAEGEERMCELSKLLLADNRTGDLRRATDDAAYRQQLFSEYGLK